MSEKMIENNKVSVIGKIVSGFTFSHEVFGEGFYMVDLEVNRLSEQSDIIPLMISNRLIKVDEDYQGCTVEAVGQGRDASKDCPVSDIPAVAVSYAVQKKGQRLSEQGLFRSVSEIEQSPKQGQVIPFRKASQPVYHTRYSSRTNPRWTISRAWDGPT